MLASSDFDKRMVEDNFDKEFNCNHKDLDAASFEKITNSFREGRQDTGLFYDFYRNTIRATIAVH